MLYTGKTVSRLFVFLGCFLIVKLFFTYPLLVVAEGTRQYFESLLHREEVKCSKALDRLTLTGQLEKDVRQLFDAKIRHFRVRQSIHKHPHYARLFAVSREFLAWRYHRFSSGWKSMARDLLL